MTGLLYVAYLAQLGMMFLIPALAIVVVRRRTKLPWMLAVAGAVAFVGSQVVHLPMLAAIAGVTAAAGRVPAEWKIVYDCAVGGIAAGLCEEWARWVVIAKWRRDARDAPSALMIGLGHGAIESMILGTLVAIGLLNMTLLRAADPAAMGVGPDQVETVRQQVDAFWSAPAYLPLLGGAERWMAMTLHVANTLIVMLAVVRRKTWLVWVAVLTHAILNAAALAAMALGGAVAAELTLFVLTLGTATIIAVTWRALSRPDHPR